MDISNELRPVYIENGKVFIIDQNLLPAELKVIEVKDWRMMVQAIKDMLVRGAPAIGISGAAGIYLAARENVGKPKKDFLLEIEKAFNVLEATRPTAVNLRWGLKKMKVVFTAGINNENYSEPNGSPEPAIVATLRLEVERIAREDFEMCVAIGQHGAEFIDDGDGILTHCNAGGLATGGFGTTLGVIRYAHRQGKRIHVYVDETRPRLQGARLTAWELDRESIPFTLISDNMAGYFMKKGEIQKVITGADRICANGDTANKIGTYSIAVLAREHKIPFYVAAPFSSFDLSMKSGDSIPIEQRPPDEVTGIYPDCSFYSHIKISNPAFDVTPSAYINAIITEGGAVWPPYETAIMEKVGKPHGFGNLKSDPSRV